MRDRSHTALSSMISGTAKVLAAAAIVVGCGKSDDGSSSKDGEDPTALRTVTFTTMAETATPLSKKTATKLLAGLDLTNYHKASAEEACVNAKAPLVDAVDSEAASSSDSVDVTECYAADAFEPLTEVTVNTRAVVRASLTVAGEGRYLVGRDLEYLREELKGDVESFDLTTFEQRVTEIKGTVDGAPVVRVERRLSQNGDGHSCLKSLGEEAGSRVRVQPCAHFFGWTVSAGDEVTESGVTVVRNDTMLEAESFTAGYFARDARMTVAINDWSGEVVYGGAKVDPQYRLTQKAGEETIETERFDDFAAGLLDVKAATSRGGCYVGTTDCDIEISYTLNREAATFAASEYEVVFASSEGTAAAEACTEENSGKTKAELTTTPLISSGLKARTTYAIRVCVRHKASGEFSPGVVTYATTPELIDD